MTDKPTTATTTAAAANRMGFPTDDQAMKKRTLLADIGGKWGKFTEQELSDLKSGDELATQIAAKYGLAKDIAQRDVTTLLNGRTFSSAGVSGTPQSLAAGGITFREG